MAAVLDQVESMEEDFTGFDEEPMVVTPAGPLLTGLEEHTDSDSGALVIAENEKKPEVKAEKSPRKRRSRVEDVTPTRAPSSRIRGQGLAYLIAMEKGGSKKQLAKAQEAQQAVPAEIASPLPQSEFISEPEPVKKAKETPKQPKEKPESIKVKEIKEKEQVKGIDSPGPDSPAAVAPKPKTGQRKSLSGFNISSPLLKEPFKEGWRREVVYRATVDPGTKTMCDVYYYAPEGKKLRSGREVADYLEKINTCLTVENFTFFKEPIGMEPDKEILRYAKTRKDDAGNEKLITKKEKALKAREEELRRNLQELGEDVAAITGQSTTSQEPAALASGATDDGESPHQKKKRGGAPKVEKQLKIKLWGKGLRSKENAEPSKDENDDEHQAQQQAKEASPAKLPDDISHLFTPKDSGARTTRSKAGANQQLELINGKRFVSIGPEAAPANFEEHAPKRALPSPSAPRQSPKRVKIGSPVAHVAPRTESAKFTAFNAQHFNSFVSHAYHGLLHVFKYLTVQELMTAARVCRLWRDLAMHHSHWRLVRLKNSRIYDWTSFASHLRRAGTKHLDMRKMLFVTSPEETWQNLEQAASNLSELSRIDLCRCPSEVLVSISKHCPRLRTIDAQSISSSSINFDEMRNLKQLEELKVRSVSSLTLDGSLEAFSTLHSLKSLSLTTIGQLQSSELKFLAELPRLENLELGDCTEWRTSEDYRHLARLSHLRHLRLERGPETDALQHLEASIGCLSQLEELELVGFTIDAPISSLQLAGLKRFLIIPSYSLENLAATMRHLYECVTSMAHLQQVCWVVTEDILAALPDARLPLATDETTGDESGADAGASRSSAGVAVDELEDALRRKLPATSIHVTRLPEYAARRYSLSMNHDD